MKLHGIALSSLCFVLFSAAVVAQATPGPRAAEPVEHPAQQARLAERHAGYREFLARAGGVWLARFDEASGSPVSIVGSGLPLGRPVRSEAEAAALAEIVLEEYPELWGAPIRSLVRTPALKSGPLYAVTWLQEFEGLEVRRARVQLQIHEAGRVASLSTTAIAIPDGFSRSPVLTPAQAAAVVGRGKRLTAADSIEAADFLVFSKSGEPRLAYRVDVQQPSAEVFERVYVDANAGSILEVEPARYDAADVKGKVKGTVNTALSGLAAPFPDVSIPFITVTAAGVGSAIADAAGNYVIPTTLPGPFNVSAQLLGPEFKVHTSQGTALTAIATTTSVAGADVADLVFNTPSDAFGTAQTDGAAHHTVIRNYVQAKVPTFGGYPGQSVNTNLPQTCNAFYDPPSKSINFYAAGGGCTNTSYSTVIYHEYGHGVDDYFGGISSPSLSEALADVCAMYSTAQPIIGEGFTTGGGFIRTGENTKTWPATSCGGEPHCLGETFMGFAWQARKKLVASLGAAAGATVAEIDFMGTFPFDNTGILNAVTQAFLLDDDNGDLTDGTPHFADLAAAAVMKGFTPPQLTTIKIQHKAFPDTWSQTQPYLIDADVKPLAPATLAGVFIDYYFDDTSTVFVATQPMAPTAVADRYRSAIPPQIAPVVVHYRIRAIDGAGNTVFLPTGDDRFRFAVGKKTTLFSDKLETGALGWTHTLVSGQDDWSLGDPQKLGVNSYDPTAPYSGTSCWGNDLQVNSASEDGLYGANVDNYLETPPINATFFNGIRIRYRRWLTVEKNQTDKATLAVAGAVVYANPSGVDQVDTTWTLQDHRATAADNANGFKARWRLASNGGGQKGGWNIDDVEIYALEQTQVLSLTITPNTTTPAIGTPLVFSFNGTPNAVWDLYAAFGPGPSSAPGYGVVDIDAGSIAYFFGNPLNGAGQATFGFTIPVAAVLQGIKLYWVGTVLAPGALPQVSNTFSITIQ